MTSRRPITTRGGQPSRASAKRDAGGSDPGDFALSLGHFVIRSLMFQAAETVQLDPDRLSFTGCFQILKCRLPECEVRRRDHSRIGTRRCFGRCKTLTDERRNRINPRVIKRKMSKWKKKRPEHRR